VRAPCVPRATSGLRARALAGGGSESLYLYGSAWFGSVFGVGFWVEFWVGLRARDFPTERVLSRTPLIIRTVDQNTTNNKNNKNKTMRTKHRKTVFAFFPFAFAFQANTRRAKTRQNMTHTHTPHTHTHTHTRRQLAVYLTSQLPPRSAAKPSISKYRSCRWTYFLATAALQFLPSFPSLCNFGARLGAPI
jgi:hypothetical protein